MIVVSAAKPRFSGSPVTMGPVQCHHVTLEVGNPMWWALHRKYPYPLPVWRDDILLGHIVMVGPENIGFAVETAILAAQQA